jgi:two-component system chemotaxis response regulator CheY
LEQFKTTKVMIVDDMRAVRMIVEKVLLRIGFLKENLLIADNGKNALELLVKNPVDLVITDLNMDEMNGLELVEACKKLPSLDATIYFVLTSDVDKERAAQLAQLGVKKQMIKPLNENELIQNIQSLFREV